MDAAYKSIIMFYQTTLRNVGLYTSISFGALGYSRYYRDKSYMHNVGMILIGLIFNIIAFTINYFLIGDMDKMIHVYSESHEDISVLEKWVILPQVIFILQLCLFLFGAHTLLVNIRP
jgi:phosphotransferase system  glucose/maltose/N-acetylglucosamine-specific IIC component